ncbi:hypothetical protein [Actinomadura sp. 21ATH]|uniref:hypothetical protein n=1 Tax=Actinomadura sp. 21ATH TaxID=1735444 RepID=UPI0035BEEE31
MGYDEDVTKVRRGRRSDRTEKQLRYVLGVVSLALTAFAGAGATLALTHGPGLGAGAAYNAGLVCVIIAGQAAIIAAVFIVGLIIYRAIRDLKRRSYDMEDNLVGHMDDETRALNTVAALASKDLTPLHRKHG